MHVVEGGLCGSSLSRQNEKFRFEQSRKLPLVSVHNSIKTVVLIPAPVPCGWTAVLNLYFSALTP
jgi:hypothetical protein